MGGQATITIFVNVDDRDKWDMIKKELKAFFEDHPEIVNKHIDYRETE